MEGQKRVNIIDTYLHHHRSLFIGIFTCLQLQYSKKKIIRKPYKKDEVLKYMISKLLKYNLNKKLQIYLVGQPWGVQLKQHFFRNRCILPIEDEMNLFTTVTV